MKDKINPDYYKGNIEVSDFIIDRNMNYFEGNIVKYISRYKDKGGIVDLHKAKWYLDKLIQEYHETTK
jgi:hypothetical protein